MTLDLTAWSAPARTDLVDDSSTRTSLLLHGVTLARTGPAEPWQPSATEHLAEHTLRIGQRPRGTAALVDALDRAELTGHGGAHVSTALKWRRALDQGGPLTVVANGAESEPLSAKDATLLRQRPHLVLDGLALAAEALGARRAVLWLHGDDTGTLYAMQAALAERRSAHYPEPWLEIVSGPGHYLAGEASAIGRSLTGGPALPRTRRSTDLDVGVPRTLVHNVETLAQVALIAARYSATAAVSATPQAPCGRGAMIPEPAVRPTVRRSASSNVRFSIAIHGAHMPPKPPSRTACGAPRWSHPVRVRTSVTGVPCSTSMTWRSTGVRTVSRVVRTGARSRAMSATRASVSTLCTRVRGTPTSRSVLRRVRGSAGPPVRERPIALASPAR